MLSGFQLTIMDYSLILPSLEKILYQTNKCHKFINAIIQNKKKCHHKVNRYNLSNNDSQNSKEMLSSFNNCNNNSNSNNNKSSDDND